MGQPGTRLPAGVAVSVDGSGADLAQPAATDAPDGYVWQPGAVYPNGSAWNWNKCNDWATLNAKCLAVAGGGDVTVVSPTRIYLESSHGGWFIPAGVWNLSPLRQEWIGLFDNASNLAALQFDNGPTSINAAFFNEYTDVYVIAAGSGFVPGFVSPGYAEFHLRGQTRIQGFLGTGCPAIGLTSQDQLSMHDQSILVGEPSIYGASVSCGGGVNFVQIHCYDQAQIQINSIVDIGVLFVLNVYSAGVSVDPMYYPYMVIHGVYVDTTGLAISTVPYLPLFFEAPSSLGSLISDMTTGLLWLATETGWQQVGGSAAASSALVFQPGGTQTGNIYTDEADLAAAAAAIDGPSTVYFDLSLVAGAYSFTTMGNLNFGQNCTWTGSRWPNTPTTLNIDAETTLSYPPNLSGSISIFVSQATPVITIQPPATNFQPNGSIALSDEAGVFVNSGSFIQLAAGGFGDFAVYLSNQAHVGGNGGSAVFLSNAANDSYFVPVWLEDGAQIQSWAFDDFESTTINILSPGVVVDFQYYYNINSISGIFVDNHGGGPTSIFAGGWDAGMQPQSLLFSAGVLYYTDTTNWIPVSGGGGGSAQASTVLFQPSGTAVAGLVFTDQDTLYTFVTTSTVPATVFCDFSFVGDSFTWTVNENSVNWGARFVGLPNNLTGTLPSIAFEDPSGFQGLELLDNMIVVISTSIVTDSLSFRLQGGTQISNAGGLCLTDVVSGESAVWNMADQSTASGTGVDAGVFDVDGSGTAIINVYDQAFLGQYAVVLTGGAVASQVTINALSAANLDPSYFTGGYVINLAISSEGNDGEIVFMAGNATTGSLSPVRMGARSVSLSAFPMAGRTITFVADISVAGGGSAGVQLYDSINNSIVTGTALSTTSTIITEVSSGPLTVGLSAGNLVDGHTYEVDLYLSSGSGQAIITNARLVISY